MILLCDLKRQYIDFKSEIDAAVQDVMMRGNYILGPNVKSFEQDIAQYVGCCYAVGVNSGTDALHLALRALGIGPGDEVITTPFTFIASTEAICLVGATPVFVDVDPHTFNIDPSRIEPAITARTKAILPVHLFGQPCDMDTIVSVADRYRLQVIEDCAQAIGATYRGRPVGSFGIAGCFSFFPSKNLGCFGDGGMLVTSDERLFERLEMLRRHGARQKYSHEELGLNSRLDELQAAVLRVKLRYLDMWNRRRRQLAYHYNELLAPLSGVQRPAEIVSQGTEVPTTFPGSGKLVEAVYHQYTIQVDDGDTVLAALQSANIGCAVYYPVPLHLQRVHANLGYRTGDLPNAEFAAERCFSLPMYPKLEESQQLAVADALAKAIAASIAKPSRKTPTPNSSQSRSATPHEPFSLTSYTSLLREFHGAGYSFVEFPRADSCLTSKQPFVLLRHDIDMDLERAVKVAEVEADMGIAATYFFLIRTEQYNLFSQRGSDCVKAILDLGHHLGLHFDCAVYGKDCSTTDIALHVSREKAILENWFGREVSIVSFHRPSATVLSGDPELTAPLEHTYMKKFVEQIHYCSDSRGEFRHGHPTNTTAFADKQPIQLLIHPIWWGEIAAQPIDELRGLVNRRQAAYLQSLEDNCTVLRRVRRTLAA